MDLLIIVILLLLGAIIGTISGLLGIGGGFITVPVLMYILTNIFKIPINYSIKIAIGTSLLVIFINGIISTYFQHKNNNILWINAIYLGIFGIIGATIGVNFSKYLSGKLHIFLFGILLILISLNIIRHIYYSKNNNNNNTNNNNNKTNKYVICAIGLFSGIISSLFGIGGGILVVPILHHTLKYNIRKSIGTSSVMIILISFSGMIGYFLMNNHINNNISDELLLYGNISIVIGFIISLTGIFFSKLGVKLANMLNTAKLNIILSIILFITGLKMILTIY